MTVATEQTSQLHLLKVWREAMQGEGQAWLYVFKGLVAILASGGVAMALSLPAPIVSMTTALIVMNPQSGMVLAKSFYRIIGTVVGVVMAVVMVGLFPQSSYFLMAAMSVWAAFCAAGAAMIRGFRGYGFLLAGYTAAMIILPVVNDPARIFTQAETRFFEVIIGLLVSALVFDGFFPRQMKKLVHGQAAKNLSFLKQAVGSGLGLIHSDVQHRIATARNADALESLVTVGVFEGPWLSQISRPLRRSNHAFLQASTRLHAWQKLGQRLVAQGDVAVLEGLKALSLPLQQCVQAELQPVEMVADLRRIGHAIREEAVAQAVSFDGASRRAFETGAALLRRIAKSLLRAQQANILIASGRDTAGKLRTPRFVRTYDPVSVGLTFVRTLLVCLVFGSLWIGGVMGTSGTPLFIIITLTSMLAPAPNPLAAVRLAATGHVLAPFLGLACFSLLPLMTTFPLFALCLTPFLLVTLYVSTRPGWAGLGMPMGIGLLVALAIGQKVSLDVGTYMNETVVTIMGVLMVAIGFIVLPGPAGKPSQIVRYRRMLDQSVTMAATRPVRGLAAMVETRNRDLGLQLLAQQKPDAPAMQAYIDHAADVQECCYAMVSLREAIGRHDVCDDVRMVVTHAIEAVVAAWPPRDAPADLIASRNAALELALAVVPSDAPISRAREHLYLLVDALADIGLHKDQG